MSPSAARRAWHRERPRRGSLDGVPGGLTGPALRLLIGASVYRESAGRNALLFQIGQARPADTADTADTAGEDPAPPYHPPADLAGLVAECEDAGLLVVPQAGRDRGPARSGIPPVFVSQRIAHALHRDLAAAGRDDEVRSAHRRAAEYWQWRAAAWPQDRHADLHDLLEARHHLREAGDDDQAGAITEVVCAQLHAWGELDQEAALIEETLAWHPPRSPQRAAWIHELAKIAQVRGDHAEAERCYWQSLEMYASAGDDAAVSRIQHRLGILAQARGDYAEAERRYQQARRLAQQADRAAAGRQGRPSDARPQEAGPQASRAHGPSQQSAERRDARPGERSPHGTGPPEAEPQHAGPGDTPRHGGQAHDDRLDDDPLDDDPRDDDPRDDDPRDDDPRDDDPQDDDPQDDASVMPGTTHGARSGARRPARQHGRRRVWRQDPLCLTGAALAVVALAALSVVGIARVLSQRGAGLAAVPAAARSGGAATARSGGAAAARSGGAAAVRHQAASWIARQLSRGAIVSCDPAMCAALRAQGLPAGDLVTLGPAAEDPLGSDVVVATAAVRSQFGGRLAGVYAPEVAAAFGAGSTRIQVRVVAPDGAIAYRNAMRADLLARKAAGAQLLRNKEISVTLAARKQLLAGQVDARMLTTLAALAAQQPVRVVGFADSGPGASAGTPLRSAEIAAFRTAGSPAAAGWGNAKFLRSALAFLRAQRPPYLAANLRSARIGAGQVAVRIQFTGPSPLGLLTAGGASADASP
jgi:tetratricopeptide (TPR) repeat protein